MNTQVKTEDVHLNQLEDEEDEEENDKKETDQENNGFFKTVWNFIYFNFFHCEPWLDKVAIEIELGNMDNLIESSYENWF